MKNLKSYTLLILISFFLNSCHSTKTVSSATLPYADIVRAVNIGLSDSKEIIESSEFKLKSGSIKLYSANSSSAQAGAELWIIEAGYNWSKEKASSITYEFSKIEKLAQKDLDAAKDSPIEPAELNSLISTAIDNFNKVESIADLDESGFTLNLKFGIVQKAEAKFNLDFGIGANVKGSMGRSVAHEINLAFVKRD